LHAQVSHFCYRFFSVLRTKRTFCADCLNVDPKRAPSTAFLFMRSASARKQTCLMSPTVASKWCYWALKAFASALHSRWPLFLGQLFRLNNHFKFVECTHECKWYLVYSAAATSCAALWFRQGRHCVPVPDYSHSKPTSPGRQTCHIRVGVKSREYWLHRYAILRVFTRCMLPCVLLSIKIIGMTGAR
jgi:hypothetical protein